MNATSKNMDFSTKHWAPYKRQYPAPFPLVSSDYIPAKTDWVRTRFGTCNFSLILRGKGRFERAGKSWPVQAPCVITQWPGESVAYGPEGGTWTEWYLVYNRAHLRRFRERGLVDASRPVWPVADPASLRLHLAEFSLLARSPDPARLVDRVDRIAERAILDTWLSPGTPSEEDSEIRTVMVRLRENLSSKWDFAEVATQHGFSMTTFRRRWEEVVGVPPARYLQELRIAEACRLLVETPLQIKAVASSTGFADEFYFSRRFRIEVGQSPREYRKTYKLRR